MIDRNTIHCWDSLEFMKTLPDKCIDMVLTDPPYLYKKMWGKWSFLESSVKKITSWLDDIKDSFNIDDYFTEIKRVTKLFNMFCFCSNEQISDIMAWGKSNNYYTTLLVWNKPNVPPFVNNVWMQDIEFIIHIREKWATFLWWTDHKRKISVIPTKPSEYWHPTEKPVSLCRKYIEIWSNPWDLILDCFACSFTTAVACIETGRDYICIEKEKEYYEIGKKRIASTTPPLFVM